MTELNPFEFVQRIADLVEKRVVAQRLIADQTAILNRVGPIYNAAMAQVEAAHQTLAELDSLIAVTQQRLIVAENKLKDRP